MTRSPWILNTERSQAKQMLFSILVSLCLCLVQGNETNSIVFAPIPAREVGQSVDINWSFSSAATNVPINLLLISDRPDVLLEPLLINYDPIPLKQGTYNWNIPRFLKTSDSYQIRAVSADSKAKVTGFSSDFTLINPHPLAQSTLTLLEPGGSADGSQLESTCLLNEVCTIRWDFPNWAASAVPRVLNVGLFTAADGKKLLEIAQFLPASEKSFRWRVPNLVGLESTPVYVVVRGPGVKVLPKPGWASYNAASAYPFILESRESRDARAAKERRSIDFLALGPILAPIFDNSTQTQTYFDVPRLTYAPVDDASSSSSDAQSLKASLVALFLPILTLFFL